MPRIELNKEKCVISEVRLCLRDFSIGYQESTEINRDTKLQDLGMDSLDIAAFLANFEEHHKKLRLADLDVSDKDITVNDLIESIKPKET